MKFGRVANESTAIDIKNELSIVPKHLINLVTQMGIQIFCFNESFTPSWIGVQKKITFDDSRTTDETACFLHDKKIISLFDCDVDDELGFSTTLHEFGHALDFALAMKDGKKGFMTDNNKDIIKGWKKQKGLDWYANLNPCEYFAQGFMAYCQANIPLYNPRSYRAHTREELKEKDSDLFYYIQSLCEK